MNDRTKHYFDDLLKRAATSTVIRRRPVEFARPNECHANCERFVQTNRDCDVVRGWLVVGGHFFIPHSVIRERETSALIDITPDPSDSGEIPFVMHMGTEEEFRILRVGRDGGFVYPSPECVVL
jgi:hypothetical protein